MWAVTRKVRNDMTMLFFQLDDSKEGRLLFFLGEFQLFCLYSKTDASNVSAIAMRDNQPTLPRNKLSVANWQYSRHGPTHASRYGNYCIRLGGFDEVELAMSSINRCTFFGKEDVKPTAILFSFRTCMF